MTPAVACRLTALGIYVAEYVRDMITYTGNVATFQSVVGWFQNHGFWIVFLAGFAPIPYNLVTISAGMFGLALLPFSIAVAVGRGARFFLIAKLVAAADPRSLPRVERYIELVG